MTLGAFLIGVFTFRELLQKRQAFRARWQRAKRLLPAQRQLEKDASDAGNTVCPIGS